MMGECGRAALRTGVILWAMLAPESASAQQAYDGFALDRFRPALDEGGILGVESAEVGRHTSWNAFAWLTGLGDPLVMTRRSDGSEVGALVSSRLALGFGGAVALWGRVELGLALPVVVFQSSSVPAADMP